MADLEILALDTTVPQIRAPGAGDGYSAPRSITMASGANLTLSGGTANGVLYLNGSKVATSGSALTFDGTNLGIGTASPAAGFMLDVTGAARVGGVVSAGAAGTVTSSFVDGLRVASYDSVGYNPSVGNNLVVGGYRSSQWVGIDFYTSGTRKATLDSSGNLGIGTTSPVGRLSVSPPSISGTSGPTYQTGLNTSKYLFTQTANSGQSFRVANTTNVAGRVSGMFFCKLAGNRVVSNTATEHFYAVFSFRILILASGGTASIQGLTEIAQYGITISTALTFTDNGSGSWHFQIANPAGNTTDITLDMEMINGSTSTNAFTTNFTASIV